MSDTPDDFCKHCNGSCRFPFLHDPVYTREYESRERMYQEAREERARARERREYLKAWE